MRQRLQKLMSAAGHCSRRQAEELLRQGRVEVNGRTAGIGDQADPEIDQVCVDGSPLAKNTTERVLLLNKPPGVISSCHDPQGRKTVLDLIPPDLRQGLHPVGRLDADSRGALLLSNQGDLTLKLTHPRYAHSKTYRVTLSGTPSRSRLQRWRQGVELDGSRTLPASVTLLHSQGDRSVLEVILREGRNRQIRRIASLLGHTVLDLQRVAIGGLALGSIEEGCWRELSRQEWRRLISTQGGEA
jgi:pseudouridine synthase